MGRWKIGQFCRSSTTAKTPLAFKLPATLERRKFGYPIFEEDTNNRVQRKAQSRGGAMSGSQAAKGFKHLFFRMLLLLVLLHFPADSILGEPAPEALTPVTAETLLDEVRSSDASLTIVNCWSTWCRPCKTEMPELVRIGEEYADRGVRLIFVSLDFDSMAEAARDTLIAKGGTLPSYIKHQKDNEFINGIHSDWGGALPATFVYGVDGNLITWWNEARTYEEFAKDINKLLE